MTIKDMHYDFKKKLNKVDSQQYRNFKVPEIDWTLNEAYEIFVKMIAMPRTYKGVLGFESTQRTIDDIRVVVVSERDPLSSLDVGENNTVTLPSNYWTYLSSHALITKGTCTNQRAKISIRQHDDEFQESSEERSSFEWRVVNAVFAGNTIRVNDDGTFEVTKLNLSYIKKLTYMHNAEDFQGGTYTLPSGTVLTGTENCELPEHTHREIVDIAVLLASGEIQSPDYQLKLSKLNMNLT